MPSSPIPPTQSFMCTCLADLIAMFLQKRIQRTSIVIQPPHFHNRQCLGMTSLSWKVSKGSHCCMMHSLVRRVVQRLYRCGRGGESFWQTLRLCPSLPCHCSWVLGLGSCQSTSSCILMNWVSLPKHWTTSHQPYTAAPMHGKFHSFLCVACKHDAAQPHTVYTSDGA